MIVISRGDVLREMKPDKPPLESFGNHFLRFRNTEVFEHLGEVLTGNRETPAGVESQETPLKSPVVQGGTFEENKAKW